MIDHHWQPLSIAKGSHSRISSLVYWSPMNWSTPLYCQTTSQLCLISFSNCANHIRIQSTIDPCSQSKHSMTSENIFGILSVSGTPWIAKPILILFTGDQPILIIRCWRVDNDLRMIWEWFDNDLRMIWQCCLIFLISFHRNLWSRALGCSPSCAVGAVNRHSMGLGHVPAPVCNLILAVFW